MKIRYCSLFILSLLIGQQVFAAEKFIPLKEIESHNSAKDCWIIVDSKVYDITNFITTHETKCDEMKLTDFCGKDASTIWLKKQNSDHSHKRKSALEFERSQIGTLIEPTE